MVVLAPLVNMGGLEMPRLLLIMQRTAQQQATLTHFAQYLKKESTCQRLLESLAISAGAHGA